MKTNHQPASTLAQKQQLLNENAVEQEIIHAVNTIMSLAIHNQDVLHIHCCYSPHIQEFSLYVHPKNQVYRAGCEYIYLLRESVVFDYPIPLVHLLKIEEELTELIIEAREQAEAEVSA